MLAAGSNNTWVARQSSRQHLCATRPQCRPSKRSCRAPAEAAAAATTTSKHAASTSQQLTAAPGSSAPLEQQPAYQQCVQRLQGMGFGEQDAERFVQRAFGWGPKARAYWRHEKNEQPADEQQLEAVLTFLSQQLGMTEDQVFKVVKAFPEVLGCDVQQQLQGNVNQLQQQWKLKDDVLVKAVLRNPPVLGYNLDCMGDCAGECNRCWARF